MVNKVIDVDCIQRIKVCGLFFLQFYKILTGSMLTLFIPQNCDGQICTIEQNYKNDNNYHKGALYWNIITMMCFLITYIYELKRENWAIKYLDINNDLPDNNLKDVIVKEKKLDKQMDKLNLYYYRIIIGTAFAYTINLLLMIKLLNENYHSSSTLSCFASFSLLVMMKLYNSLSVGYHSVKSDKMMSAYMSEFVSFNVLDEDYVKSKEDSQLKKTNIVSKNEVKIDEVKMEEIVPSIQEN